MNTLANLLCGSYREAVCPYKDTAGSDDEYYLEETDPDSEPSQWSYEEQSITTG